MTIQVRLIHRDNRRFLEAQWEDPVTGMKKTRSTGTTVRREAERFAARLEARLNGGERIDAGKITWDSLWRRYKEEVLPGLAQRTRNKTGTAVNALTRLINPNRAASLTSEVLLTFSTKLRDEEKSTYSIRGYLGEIRKILRWGERLGLIGAAPVVEMPKAIGGMKGRPITGEEFDRMIAKIPVVCGTEGVESWERLLNGLWLSGLRLSEALALHWTDDRNLCVELTGKYPMLRIQAHAQKSRRFELLPITSDFAGFLKEIPEQDRHGFVFNPRPFRTPFDQRPLPDWVGKIISRIGEKAKVKVGENKTASAHDLRRAFGARWAIHVMPAVLQALMRHRSISTTMQFYVGKNAEAMAEAAWRAALGNTFANTSPSEAPETTPEPEETPEN